MDARLTAEQHELRDAAARLAGDLGPGSVHDLDDADRVARLEKAVAATGWRTLRSDGATGVEVAIVAEEFGRRLVDVPFLGPVLADDLRRSAWRPRAGPDRDLRRGAADGGHPWTIAVDGEAMDARGAERVLTLSGNRLLAGRVGAELPGADLTRRSAAVTRPAQAGRRAVRRARRTLAGAGPGRHVRGPARDGSRRARAGLRLREGPHASTGRRSGPTRPWPIRWPRASP